MIHLINDQVSGFYLPRVLVIQGLYIAYIGAFFGGEGGNEGVETSGDTGNTAISNPNKFFSPSSKLKIIR